MEITDNRNDLFHLVQLFSFEFFEAFKKWLKFRRVKIQQPLHF